MRRWPAVKPTQFVCPDTDTTSRNSVLPLTNPLHVPARLTAFPEPSEAASRQRRTRPHELLPAAGPVMGEGGRKASRESSGEGVVRYPGTK